MASQPMVVQAQVVGGAPVQVQMLSTGFYSRVPRRGICQFCNADVMTQVSYEVGLGTHLMCMGIALVGCICGCCFIPYCSDSFKDARHTCPNCKQTTGVKTVL